MTREEKEEEDSNCFSDDEAEEEEDGVTVGDLELFSSSSWPVVEPHGVALFVIRPAVAGVAAYVGSDFHLSCGKEVDKDSWSYTERGTHSHLYFKLQLGRSVDEGHVWLYLPSKRCSSQVKGPVEKEPVAQGAAFAGLVEGVGDDVWKFQVRFGVEGGDMEVSWLI